MTTRDRIKRSVENILQQIEDAAYDHDLTADVRSDLKWLHLGIENALNLFNQPTIPDPFTTFRRPTREDLEGTVRHDIG